MQRAACFEKEMKKEREHACMMTSGEKIEIVFLKQFFYNNRVVAALCICVCVEVSGNLFSNQEG